MLGRDDLDPHQLEGVNWLTDDSRPHAGLWWRMGRQKTATVLTAFSDLQDGARADAALILAPKHVCLNVWPNEVQKWSHLRHLQVAHLRATEAEGRPKLERIENETKAERRARLEAAVDAFMLARLRSRADLFLCPYDWLLDLAYILGDVKDNLPFDLVVYDELTRLKSHGTKRWKEWRKLLPRFPRRWGLTGSLTAHGLLPLYGQMVMVDGGARLGRQFRNFRSRYFVQQDYMGYDWAPRDGAEAEVLDRLSDVVHVLDKADDQLPPVDHVLTVHLDERNARRYRELEKDFVLDLDEHGRKAMANRASLGDRCRQLAQGVCYFEAFPDVTDLSGDQEVEPVQKRFEAHSLKLDVLESVIEEAAGEPVLVAFWYKFDPERIRARLGPHVPVFGRGSDRVNAQLYREWNERQHPVMLVHPQSAGHGLNLQDGGRHLCFYTVPWSLEQYEQTVGRLDRRGQQSRVHVHHIIVKDTIEEVILQTLRDRDDSQTNFMTRLDAYRRGRFDRAA